MRLVKVKSSIPKINRCTSLPKHSSSFVNSQRSSKKIEAANYRIGKKITSVKSFYAQ